MAGSEVKHSNSNRVESNKEQPDLLITEKGIAHP